MKISIIGAGNIGGTLGRKWAQAGHAVAFGVRDPQEAAVQSLVAELNGETTAVSIPASAAEAEVVLFAVPGQAMPDLVATLGDQLNGKILIDATNKVGQASMNSLELLRQHAPDSALYRAFSTLGWENFAEPVLDGVAVDLFYCGDAKGGKVEELITAVGLRPIYVGGTEQADLIDTLARLWFVMALQQGRGRHLAFKMIGA